MSEKISVSEEVQQLIEDVILKHGLNPVVEVKYSPGAEVGDGYVSQTVAASITNSNSNLDLFLKYALKKESSETEMIDTYYANEMHFYDVVYPTFQKFSTERGNEIGFPNVPKCYGTSAKRIVALENLKKRGFRLFERNRNFDDVHIKLVLKAFAKFHAAAFAYKDRKRKTYDELVQGTFDILSDKNGEQWLVKILRGTVKDFLKKLDPIVDKDILEHCNVEELVAHLSTTDRALDEYSILTKGDCWCSNMMFLYEDGDTVNPKDVALIDWQVMRPASVAFDISYFYLTVASEEVLAQTEEYLRFYHDELSTGIRRLGNDPEALYPFRVFLEEWKRHSRFGFVLATLVIKLMLTEKEETVDLERLDINDTEQLENLYPKFDNEEEFLRRMRVLAKYMIRNGYL